MFNCCVASLLLYTILWAWFLQCFATTVFKYNFIISYVRVRFSRSFSVTSRKPHTHVANHKTHPIHTHKYTHMVSGFSRKIHRTSKRKKIIFDHHLWAFSQIHRKSKVTKKLMQLSGNPTHLGTKKLMQLWGNPTHLGMYLFEEINELIVFGVNFFNFCVDDSVVSYWFSNWIQYWIWNSS